MNKKNYTYAILVTDIKINDLFWSKMIEKVRKHVIPYQWEALNDRIPNAEPSYCMQNFRVAAAITRIKKGAPIPVDEELIVKGFHGHVFQESDMAKWIEAVGYSLALFPDTELETATDEAIDLICSCQQDDGYLNTYYIINGLDKKFTNLAINHELYCLGHFIEGAVAYYQATKKDKLLNAVIKYVDCVNNHIGIGADKILGYPGHEVLEMALMRLYAITKNEMHRNLACYFIDQRGQKPLYFEKEIKDNNVSTWKDSYFQYQYFQAGLPVRDQTQAEGHAVRAVYFYSGMADVAKATNDEGLIEACKILWKNIAEKQNYITGAIGQSEYGESFLYDYELPNDTVYAETCAQIGLAFFARRMLEVDAHNSYGDLMERAIYNGLISGMSLDGKSFFYVNPLEVVPEASLKDHIKKHVKVTRQKWFGCACCPPNIARFLSSIGTYAYTMNENTIYTHLYIGGALKATMNGTEVIVNVEGNFPWDENISISFDMKAESAFTYALRIPGWCKNYVLNLNDEKVDYSEKNGYVYINRVWKQNDKLTLVLKMPVVVVKSNPKVRENIGKVAVMRGPIVYCLEEADNGKELHKVFIDSKLEFTSKFETETLGGLVTLSSKGKKLSQKGWRDDSLYMQNVESTFEEVNLKWIPYYSWANRGEGEMIVWVHEK